MDRARDLNPPTFGEVIHHSDALESPTLGEVVRRLDGLDRKLDRVLDDYERRLRSVERWVYTLPPTLILAAASLVVGIFGR